MRYLLFIFFLSSFFGFSQKSETITKSTMNAYVYDNPSNVSITLCELKKNTKVTVEAYSGFNYWQVKTKKCSGYVGTIVLIVNEEMKKMKLEYEETLYNKAEKERKQFEKERKQSEKEKLVKEKKRVRILDNIRKDMMQLKKKALIKKENERKQKQINDSIYMVEQRNKCIYYKNEIDEFDKIRKIITMPISIKNNYSKEVIVVTLKRYGVNKYVEIDYNGDLGCVSPYSNDRSFVKFKLENNDIITFYHSGDIDCSDFVLFGKLSNSEISRLKNLQ